jgi:hypothetical protein
MVSGSDKLYHSVLCQLNACLLSVLACAAVASGGGLMAMKTGSSARWAMATAQRCKVHTFLNMHMPCYSTISIDA